MDFLTFLTSIQVKEISAVVVLVGVVGLILTGRLVPRRNLNDALEERDAWKQAHAVSETARAGLNRENFKLLETARISDQFYRDFLPAVSAPNDKHKRPSGSDDDVAV